MTVLLKPTCDLKEASRKSTALLHRIIISQAIVSSALEVPKVSEALAKEVVRGHMSGKTGLADALPQFLISTDSAKSHDSTQAVRLIIEGLAQQTIINTEMVIAAAAVVLSHSTADDFFTSSIQLAIDLDPNNWLSEINLEQKVTLKELNEKKIDDILVKALLSFRNQIGRKESLPSRAKLLFRKIKIQHNSHFELKDPKRFRMTRLREIDELRVQIVHGTPWPKIDVDESKDIMLFLHEAATTAARSVGAAFNLPLDLEYFQQLAK
ncbi:MAG TPA: hypothetical protein VMH89_05720 [Candidatus Acidoferrum sp.]|nr:hypothetical protein [Candidatus Acidoferrum sp.]